MGEPVNDFGSLFEFLPIGAYRSAPDGRQLRANPALVAQNGYASEAELLAAVHDIGVEWYVQPGRRDEFKRLLETEGRVIGFESEVRRHKTRERIWVNENAHIVRDGDGRVLYYEGTVEEITDRVRDRQALRDSQEQLRQIVELVPGMIYRVLVLPDGQRRATFASPGSKALLGITPEQVLADGMLMHRLRHPDDRERLAQETAQAIAAGVPWQSEYRVQLDSGEVKWVQAFSARAPAGADGHEVRVGVVFDISDRKRAEQALQLSESRMASLLSLLPGVVYRLYVDPDGRRRYGFISDYVRTLYGVEPAAVLADGDVIVRMRHPDGAGAVEQAALPRMLAGRPLDYEVRIVAADGREKWIEVHSRRAPPEDDSGTQVRVGVLLDITQRKQAELALQAQAEVWKRAIEASGDGVWDWHIQDGIEILSPQCKALYGFTPDELSDSPDALDERTHPDDRARMAEDREAHFAGRNARYVNEHRVRCKDGSWKWVLSRGLVISRDAAGQPLRMIGTHTDIHARKQAEALRQERDRAEAADRAKSEFLSRVSHELRTPLNAILGFAQLLELDPGPATPQRQQGWVQQVLSSGRHLLALMDDILDLSSAQTGQLPVSAEPLLLRPVVEEALAMVAATAHGAGITLVDDLPRDATLALRADRKRLKQILSNLLSNAIKYNQRDGWVRVGARAREGGVEVTVADNGPGLSEAQQRRLFAPFERLGAQRGPVAGTGLGLALSQQLAHAMGGRIEVDSAAGKGACFRLWLPTA
jgi:PAS domain S-box-containing protein